MYVLSLDLGGSLGSNGVVVATAQIDSRGAFHADIVVPDSLFALKRHLITAADRTGIVASVEHVLPPAEIDLSHSSGTIGSVISLDGTGFPIDVPPSSLTFLGNDISLSGFSSTNGSGEINLDVELSELLAVGTGQMTLTIGATVASAPFEKIPATLAASRTTDFILLTAAGFPRNTIVSSITVDRLKRLGDPVFTDANGEFSIRIMSAPRTPVEIIVIVANTSVRLVVPSYLASSG